ncbi:hypothetical protein N7537_007505 [Penicillium hordei]|uniref:Uncharacterized protein n=1 Tax=Penicillium hordei TaxID=40994 RepID=A0AAD6DZV9_9EURO|nr:uncharacterized protein N7537_007505 [Penicillium hordei]KAJ5597421.1 hypothetical protein N7537_007505 [Penicillium hordei]
MISSRLRNSYRNDKEVYKYKIAELTESSNDLDNYANYTFVIYKCINRTSEEVVLFINIKSEGLRDILRGVLYDIKAVSLIEDKLSNVLFYFLPELDRYVENIDNSSYYISVYTEYLRLLINHLKRFLSLVAIFIPYILFRGLKPIATLKAYPLYYYPSHEEARKDLVERGQKFLGAFFINKGNIFKININSRVAVDAVFFYKIQPNYSRPSLRDIGVKDKNSIIRTASEGRREYKETLSETNFLVAYLNIEYVVSALRDVDWLPKSFDCLKIPLETKTILLLLAKTRLGIIPTVPFDDYIGKPSILLRLPNLTYTSSLPGVGKTFTVKVTSEYFKLPLYSVNLLLTTEILIRLRPTIIKDYELRRLESLALNRREIKNVAAIVYALAKANVN